MTRPCGVPAQKLRRQPGRIPAVRSIGLARRDPLAFFLLTAARRQQSRRDQRLSASLLQSRHLRGYCLLCGQPAWQISRFRFLYCSPLAPSAVHLFPPQSVLLLPWTLPLGANPGRFSTKQPVEGDHTSIDTLTTTYSFLATLFLFPERHLRVFPFSGLVSLWLVPPPSETLAPR